MKIDPDRELQPPAPPTWDTPSPVASIALITACLPGRHQWLPDLAAAIRQTRSRCANLAVTWTVVFDGPGEHTDADRHLAAADAIVLTTSAQGGVGAARNHALYSDLLDSIDYVAPVDADDLIDPAGLAATINDLNRTGFDWAAANRTLLTGERTPHWHGRRTWTRGAVADTWTAPLAFHPNSIITSTDLARRVGGWPEAMPANEDLLFVMTCNEESDGISVPHELTRYRTWEGQVVNHSDYPQAKAAAFTRITDTLHARRGPGSLRVIPPPPGAAPGTIATATPPLSRISMPTAWNYATDHGETYLAAGLITATRLDADYEWTTSHGSRLLGREGDWHARNDIDEWTIEAPVFAATYSHVTGNQYRKTTPIAAVQILTPMVIDTLEGDAIAAAGDWLIASTVEQDAWPVRAAAFWHRYPDGPNPPAVPDSTGYGQLP